MGGRLDKLVVAHQPAKTVKLLSKDRKFNIYTLAAHILLVRKLLLVLGGRRFYKPNHLLDLIFKVIGENSPHLLLFLEILLELV